MSQSLAAIAKLHVGFIRESNRIEGITRAPFKREIAEFERFLSLSSVRVEDLIDFVNVYQPGAKLRERGMNVKVGDYFPPLGGELIRPALEAILAHLKKIHPVEIHQRYERLYPFTDGNGRSGRMLWAWHMAKWGYDFKLGFLH